MTRRAAILGCVVLAATACGGAALAVPPVLAPDAMRGVVDDYMAAIRDNDLEAYRTLFAPDARITSDWPEATGRDAWLKAIAVEFAPTRRTRFLAVFSDFVVAAGKPATRVLLVQEIKDCRAGIPECLGQFRSETLTLQDGRIVALDRAMFTHRLTGPGAWTFDAP